MLVSENPTENDDRIYDVVVNGETHKKGVTKIVANNYILSLNEDLQSRVKLVPVTPDGKQILLG